MFSKNRQFNLHSPTNKKKTTEQKKQIDFTSQVIICGSLTDKFLAGINGGKFAYNEEDRYTTFLFSITGEFTIRAEINLESDIIYTESRKRNKPKEIEYNHEDNFKKQISSSSLTSSHYTVTKANFQTPSNTWIIIAAKDAKERGLIFKELTSVINHSRFKLCLFLLPDLIEGHMRTWSEDNIPLTTSHILISNIFSIKDLQKEGKEFEKILIKDAKTYLESLEDEVVENLKQEAIQEIEAETHQKAEQYFADHSQKCNLM